MIILFLLFLWFFFFFRAKIKIKISSYSVLLLIRTTHNRNISLISTTWVFHISLRGFHVKVLLSFVHLICYICCNIFIVAIMLFIIWENLFLPPVTCTIVFMLLFPYHIVHKLKNWYLMSVCIYATQHKETGE